VHSISDGPMGSRLGVMLAGMIFPSAPTRYRLPRWRRPTFGHSPSYKNVGWNKRRRPSEKGRLGHGAVGAGPRQSTLRKRALAESCGPRHPPGSGQPTSPASHTGRRWPRHPPHLPVPQVPTLVLHVGARPRGHASPEVWPRPPSPPPPATVASASAVAAAHATAPAAHLRGPRTAWHVRVHAAAPLTAHTCLHRSGGPRRRGAAAISPTSTTAARVSTSTSPRAAARRWTWAIQKRHPPCRPGATPHRRRRRRAAPAQRCRV